MNPVWQIALGVISTLGGGSLVSLLMFRRQVAKLRSEVVLNDSNAGVNKATETQTYTQIALGMLEPLQKQNALQAQQIDAQARRLDRQAAEIEKQKRVIGEQSSKIEQQSRKIDELQHQVGALRAELNEARRGKR